MSNATTTAARILPLEAVSGLCVRTRRDTPDFDGIMVADLHYTGTPFSPEERTAYANLFAAAPDLLDELRHTERNLASMLHMLPLSAPEVERRSLVAWLERTRAAIAKAAKGEGWAMSHTEARAATVTAAEARAEIERHHPGDVLWGIAPEGESICSGAWEVFTAEYGTHDTYAGDDVLAWLGY